MTDLQILRSALMDEIARTKRGVSNAEEVATITKAANAISETYKVELTAARLLLDAQELGLQTLPIKVFEQTDKQLIDFKAKDG